MKVVLYLPRGEAVRSLYRKRHPIGSGCAYDTAPYPMERTTATSISAPVVKVIDIAAFLRVGIAGLS